jgi:hypothetical protein
MGTFKKHERPGNIHESAIYHAYNAVDGRVLSLIHGNFNRPGWILDHFEGTLSIARIRAEMNSIRLDARHAGSFRTVTL